MQASTTSGHSLPTITTLRIPDESWQDGVEGILGRSRFDLPVPPEHYDAAMRLYQQRHLKDDLHGVGLLDAAISTPTHTAAGFVGERSVAPEGHQTGAGGG